MKSATVLHDVQHARKVRGSPVESRGVTSAEPKRITAVERAVRVLRAFSVGEPRLGVNEIARRVGLHKSTVSRLVATLEDAHLLERDPDSGRFALGPGIVALAGPLLANLNIREVARPYLEQL